MARHFSPAVVEVTRGNFLESTHLVDIVVTDTKGKVVEAWGNHDQAIYPRSSAKALQALAMVESGAAEAFGFDERHLALACSSHNGEPVHASLAADMLGRTGLENRCLECGVQLPDQPDDLIALAVSGKEPTALHNNCSGKHAGFVAFAKHAGLPIAGYVKLDHPVQAAVAGILAEVTDAPHSQENAAIDGCSIPTYRIPMANLARAFARFGVSEAKGEIRAKAMARLRESCFAHPYLVAGKKRACTRIMEILPKRAFVKIGAEGVYIAALPELGYGVAMKIRDGEKRAAEPAISAAITRYLDMSEDERAGMSPLVTPVLRNRRDIVTGSIRTVLS